MKTLLLKNYNFLTLICLVFLGLTSTSCSKEDPEPLKSTSFDYQLHNGQVVPNAPYAGVHASNLTAKLLLNELENGMTKITVTLDNTIDGATYHMHAHDAADPSSTPNGTPYNESPNQEIFAKAVTGNGGKVSISQEANIYYKDLLDTYNGFFVIHDPLQDISTTDISTFLVVGGFARKQTETSYQSSVFNYAFNTGQLVADFAYDGAHADNLSASITIDELADNKSRVVVQLQNTQDGKMYHTHAHDAADPATTPNGTPYIEAPNANVFVSHITGNGGASAKAVISTLSYSELINNYNGFFVVHDPLQTISTTNPKTFVILGLFAR